MGVNASARKVVAAGMVWGVIAVGSGGCAGIDFSKAEDNQEGRRSNGIRYYRPATYLLITPDYEQKAAKVTLWHGPDTSVTYVADPYAWFAKNTTLMEFENGMLKKVSSEADSTKVAETTIKAAVEVTKEMLDQLAKQAQVAAALAKAGAAALLREEPGGGKALTPAIFLFVASEDGLVQVYPPKGRTQPTGGPRP